MANLISQHLTERRATQVDTGINCLQAAVTAGVVPNKVFTDAKDTFNRAAEEAANAFLATGPKFERHNQSDWWLAAYANNAFVGGTHNVPVALQRARKIDDLKAYADFIEQALLPLHALLQDAKPLIKKRTELPKQPTKRETDRAGHEMTCQCCGRGIFANLGTIALHGYERSGQGWQTGSCIGAKELPFEVSREKLGWLITSWQARRKEMIAARREIMGERAPITVTVADRSKPRSRTGVYPTKALEITRANFFDHMGEVQYASFDSLLKYDSDKRAGEIKNIGDAIKQQQARYDGWTQTHQWNAETKTWEAL